MRGLSGKRIIVAGGATGIGAATARRLASEGARVVVGDINVTGAEATVKAIKDAGGVAELKEFDLADEASVTELVRFTVDTFGGVEGLANVGADVSSETIGRDRHLLEMDLKVWDRTLRVNLIGYALTIRAVLPYFLETGGGAIVNTSSGAVSIGEATRPAYAASKAGVNTLTRHVARRWGPKSIRCNTVMPGAVLSETMLRSADQAFLDKMRASLTLPRLGQPEDLANTICFLLSEDSSWVNGQAWSVNGGAGFRD